MPGIAAPPCRTRRHPAAGAPIPRSRPRSSTASRDRRTVTSTAGRGLSFRDRVGLPSKSVIDGPLAMAARDAGRPWRIVPGGTSIRAGVHLGPGVVVMPPSFINIGAWIGEDTMVDSHVLVGSCAQVGARVHLAAGVSIGGVLEPPGARPVIVEDDSFVGAGSLLLDGVLVGAGAVIGAGVVLTGTSRVYDLVRERVLTGTPDAAAGHSAERGGRARVSPRRRPVRGRARAVRLGRPARQGPRPGHRCTGRARGRAPMSAVRQPGPPPARHADAGPASRPAAGSQRDPARWPAGRP